MTKEKSKNKNKFRQNKNLFPKIKQYNNNLPIKIKQPNYKSIQENKNNDLEHLNINYQKEQILPKANLGVKNINLPKNVNNKANNKNRNKKSLKYLLKEYGLIEYYKKFNELGYNNDNYTQIGNLTRRSFASLINQINMVPFHYEKIEKFYEYLKKLNRNNNSSNKIIKQKNQLLNPMSSTTPQFQKRRFNFHLNNNNYNLINNENNKTNIIYNQYQNYYNNYIQQNQKLNNNNNYIFNRKSLNIKRGNINKIYKKAKSRPRPHTSNPKLYSNKNKNIKIKMRHNYSGKKLMKKKLKNISSINKVYLSNSIEDNSSLIRSYFNDYQNLAENHKMNLINKNISIIKKGGINPIYHRINDNFEEYNVLYKSQNNYLINKEENDLNDNIDRMLNQYMMQLNEKLDKSYETIEDSSLSHIVTSQITENKNENVHQENKEEIKNNESEKEKIVKEEGESSRELKRLSAHDSSTKSKESKEPQIEELIEEKKYITKEEATQLLSEMDYPLNNKKYNLEQNIYETLRLNKSYDEENNQKETVKYDIEFICRCLGLALMKLIEQGQEREHITELFDENNKKNNKYNFYFLNEEFNNNINLLEEFFNELNSKDNNDKNKILGDFNLLPIIEKLELKNGEITNDSINMLNHIKKTGEEKYIIKEDNNIDKLKNDLFDIDKELKIFGNYYTYKRAKKDYQGLSENTKKILGKDLSYIKEIDSEINHTGSKGNNSNLNLSKSKANNNSIDSKDNQENMNKILDDSAEYEDEFLKEKCIDDLLEEKEEEKKETKQEIKDEEKEEEIITSKYKNNKDSSNDNNKDKVNDNISLKKYQEQTLNTQDIESSYIIDVKNIQEFKLYLKTKLEIFDEDYLYISNSIPAKRPMQSPDPQTIFEFCANIMLLTKMEKEIIIIALIYIERLIFNTGLLITSRNWRKLIFIALLIASKIWDDDSLENIHFSQIFAHLKIGEINSLEKNFMELINYKVFVKFSEFMKYYFALKDMCLKFNYNGEKIVGIKPDKIIRIQEYRYQLQKRMSKTMSLNNSASF